MRIPDEVLKIADDIRTMRIRGAGKIARAAAEALKIAAEKYDGPASEDVFRKYMAHVAETLLATRPTAVSLPNAILYVMHSLEKTSGSLEVLRKAVVKAADNFIRESLQALKKISEYGARRIKYDSVVLTHCHSTASVSVITKAYEMGKIRKVYSTETRPFYQGRITTRQLLEKGVPVIQIPDSAVKVYHA